MEAVEAEAVEAVEEAVLPRWYARTFDVLHPASLSSNRRGCLQWTPAERYGIALEIHHD